MLASWSLLLWHWPETLNGLAELLAVDELERVTSQKLRSSQLIRKMQDQQGHHTLELQDLLDAWGRCHVIKRADSYTVAIVAIVLQCSLQRRQNPHPVEVRVLWLDRSFRVKTMSWSSARVNSAPPMPIPWEQDSVA
ncbi:hypothetical protein F5H01DRAFT_396441 [Linnemannia elongata]|nr:hypothetical protein F5H01DRAFT_396441 [Linnemannia elongata]